MMSIEFTIGGNRDKLRFPCCSFALYKVFGQVGGCEIVRIIGGMPIEGDATGEGGIIKENRHMATIAQWHDVWLRRVDWVERLPGCQQRVGHTTLSHDI